MCVADHDRAAGHVFGLTHDVVDEFLFVRLVIILPVLDLPDLSLVRHPALETFGVEPLVVVDERHMCPPA